ncbi:MAG: dephospho-CoA kinase [Actinomycetes bacterium]
MLLVALTGGIGSGKSLAGEYLAALGAIVVDSDQLARAVVERGTPAFDEIVARFGDEILKDGKLDRSKLGELVFSDPAARAELEAITHPRIREALDEIVASCDPDDVIVNQIPLLVETGGKDRFDYIISITAPLELRRERCIARGMKSYEFEKRVAAQASDEERVAISNHVIDNTGDADALLRAIEELWESELKPRAIA